jgi:hypothetical protein
MQEAAQDIVDWQETVHSMPIVRLLSDNTVSCFTATSLRHLWTPQDAFRVCFKTTEAAIDLTHRDVDIGLAPERPQLGNVAVRRSVAVAYAPKVLTTGAIATGFRWVRTSPTSRGSGGHSNSRASTSRTG